MIGPVLLGMQKPVSILQMGTSVESIVNLAAFTALRAQGGAMEIAITGMQRCGNSPVFGVLPTR